MRQRLFLLALVAGCGSVGTPPTDSGGDDLGTLRQGCAVMLRMDEASWGGASSVLDTCGTNHGTPSGTLGTAEDGVRGRAGRFQGDGCITVADTPALRASTTLTFSAWVKPSGLDGVNARGVLSKRVDMMAQSAYNLYLWTGNRAWVDIDGNNDRFANLTQLANNAWTQLTVVYDGARPADQRVRVYTNGAFDIAGAESAASIPPHNAPLYVGCLPSPSSQTMQYFVGLIDEVAVWSRALTDAEISQWYSATRPR